jgi:hypothetical protein
MKSGCRNLTWPTARDARALDFLENGKTSDL